MMNWRYTGNQSGITLVELIVTIVVVAVAVTGVLLAVQFAMRHSADPMIRQQQVAIAEAYMEEIMLREYGAEEYDEDLEADDRPRFQDVREYRKLDEEHEPRNQNHEPLGLSQYRVTVNVTNSTMEEDVEAAKIEVTVDHDAAVSFTLTGYKTKH